MFAKVEHWLPLGSHMTDPETETREGTRPSLVVLSEHTWDSIHNSLFSS